jgi:hypothetical protein
VKGKLNEYEQPADGMRELWERVQDKWNNIPTELCQKLIGSMGERIEAVIDGKGDVSKL